jgi:hypothetical protein
MVHKLCYNLLPFIVVTDLGERLKGLPLELPDKLVEKVISRMDGLSNLIKNVGLCPHPRCFIVLPSNLDGNPQAIFVSFLIFLVSLEAILLIKKFHFSPFNSVTLKSWMFYLLIST